MAPKDGGDGTSAPGPSHPSVAAAAAAQAGPAADIARSAPVDALPSDISSASARQSFFAALAANVVNKLWPKKKK